jgi:hypothetical protein
MGRLNRLAFCAAILVSVVTPVLVIGPFVAATLGYFPFWVLATIFAVSAICTALTSEWSLKALDPSWSTKPWTAPPKWSVTERPCGALKLSLYAASSCIAGASLGYVLLHWTATAVPAPLQIIVFGLVFLASIFVALVLAIGLMRAFLVEMWMKGSGRFAPIGVLSMLLVWLVALFGNMTYALHVHGVLQLHAANGAHVSPNLATELYLWHFADTVPLINAPTTLHWAPPLTYSGAAEGALIIVFVIVGFTSVIAVFVQYLQSGSNL